MTKEQVEVLDQATVTALIDQLALSLNINRIRASELIKELDITAVLPLITGPTSAGIIPKIGATAVNSHSNYATTASPVAKTWRANTSGKTFYMTGLQFNSDTAGQVIILRDGAGGTETARFRVLANTADSRVFTVPVKYSTGVQSDSGDQSSSVNVNLDFQGWEE